MNKVVKKIFRILLFLVIGTLVFGMIYIAEKYDNIEIGIKDKLVIIEDKNGEVLTYHISDSLNIVKFIIKEDKICISEKVLGRWREQFDVSIDRR